jgi:hypothetical protein
MSTEFGNELKSVSVNVLENAIAKAISELLGEEYECTFSNISFESFSGVKFEAKIYKPLNFLGETEKNSA